MGFTFQIRCIQIFFQFDILAYDTICSRFFLFFVIQIGET